MTVGLRGSDIVKLPQNDEDLFAHIEAIHHIPVRRAGETGQQCKERFQRENPEAGGPNCKCPACSRRRKLMCGIGAN